MIGYFQKLNKKCNFIILKILSDKIKELINVRNIIIIVIEIQRENF